jgi:TolA-binding protein
MISDVGSSGFRIFRIARIALVVALVALVAGCAEKSKPVAPGSADADKFLFERGEKAAKEKKWLQAREYYRNIVDNYPQSSYRPDAKLALGDTYLTQGGTENLLLGGNEFREFLTF